MATVDKEKTAAEATALFDQGIAKIKANEMDNAIELLGKCLELRTAAFGENAIETAQAYHKYGCALFYKAQDENTVFGARAQEAADAKKEADAAANDASDEGEDVGDDDDADDASAENADAPSTDADPEEGEKEEGAQQDDMELAWEMIECARLIYETEMDDLDGDTSGGHPIDLANVYEILGDINTEASNFKESLDDYSKCLALLEAHVDEAHVFTAGKLVPADVWATETTIAFLLWALQGGIDRRRRVLRCRGRGPHGGRGGRGSDGRGGSCRRHGAWVVCCAAPLASRLLIYPRQLATQIKREVFVY